MIRKKSNKPFYYDLFYYALFQGAPILAGFFSLPLYSSQLSTEQYGHYSLIMATLNILAILSINWITVSTIRYYSEFEEGEDQGVLSTISFLALGGTTLLAGALLFGISLTGLIDIQPFGIILLMFFLMNVERLVVSYLKASRQVKANTMIKTLYVILRFALIVVFLLIFDMGIESIFYANIVGASVTIFLGVYVHGISFSKFKREDLEKAKEYFSYGVPFIWILGIQWILTASDRYMLEFMVGTGEMGIYSLNYSMVQKIMMPLITIFISTAAPIIFQQAKMADGVGAQKTLNDTFKFFLLLILPSVMGLSLISQEIGRIFIRNEFQEGIVIIPIIAFSLLFLGIRLYTNIALEVEKKSKEIGNVAIIAGLSNIGLNLLLIPRFSYVGASFASLIAYFLYFVLSYEKTKRLAKIRVQFTGVFIKILISAAAMAPPLLFIQYFTSLPSVISLGLKLLIGIGVYGGCVFGFRLIEIKQIKALLQKRRANKEV